MNSSPPPTPEKTTPATHPQTGSPPGHHQVTIVGGGYAGLPLAQVFAAAGVATVVLDVDAERVAAINRGESYVEDVPAGKLRPHVEAGMVVAAKDYGAARGTDAGPVP